MYVLENVSELGRMADVKDKAKEILSNFLKCDLYLSDICN